MTRTPLASQLHRFGRRHIAAVLTAAVLAWWCWSRLRDQLLALTVLLAAAAVTIWIVRRRRELAAAAAIAATSAAVPAAVMLELLQRDPTSTSTAAILTGYAVLAPAPTVTAWTLHPALVSRTRSALLGSLVLLITAVPAVLLPWTAALLLPTAAIGVCGTLWLRNHRHGHADHRETDLGSGWTDLGARRLPTGQPIAHLAVGGGYAITACTAPAATPSRAVLIDTVRRAAAAADAIDLPVHRMQPVLLSDQVQALPTHHLVNTGAIAAMVIVARPDQLPTVAAAAPHRRWWSRRPLHLARSLPALTPSATAA